MLRQLQSFIWDKLSVVELFWTLALLNVVDFILTSTILNYGGREGNPYVDWFISHFGSKGILIPKVIPFAVLGIVIFYCWHMIRPATQQTIKSLLVFANLAYAAVIVYSICVLIAQVSIYL